MYAVVGCTDCSALWVVETDVETSGCPRCERRHRLSKLKQFVTTEDEDHAREVRASMLAARSGHSEAFAELDSFAAMESGAEDAGMSDEEYLSAAGLDADEVADAGDRAGSGTGGGTSDREVVESALSDLDRPTGAEVAAYAAERGVDRSYVERALEKLVRRGEVTESGGRYRRL